MEAKHGRVYGWDSQTGMLMVSKDNTSWDHRGRLGLADIAVSPTDPDEIVATTQDGVASTREEPCTAATRSTSPPRPRYITPPTTAPASPCSSSCLPRDQWPCWSCAGCSTAGCGAGSSPRMAGPMTKVDSENIAAMTASAMTGAIQVWKRR